MNFLPNHIITTIQSVNESAETIFGLVSPYAPATLSLQIMNRIGSYYTRLGLIKAIIRSANNLPEYTFLLTGMGLAFRNTHNQNNCIDDLQSLINYMIDDIRKRKFDQSDLLNAYETWNFAQIDDVKYTLSLLIAYENFATNWLHSCKGLKINTMNISPLNADTARRGLVGTQAVFSLGKLIKIVFKEQIPDLTLANGNEKLMQLFKEVEKDTSDESSPLQIVEIAVNEGTVKPFIQASITELIQNSIDAVRYFNPQNKKINISIQKSSDLREIYLLIKDYVGMGPDAFLYIAIPFLSTKTASQIQTGEIGSGFFNVYRQSNFVIVESYKDGVRRSYYDKPVLDSNGRVVDIIKRVSFKKDAKPDNINWTTITIGIPISYESRIPSETDPSFIKIISEIEFYCRNVIGLASMPSIEFMNKNIYVMRTEVDKVGPFTVYMLVSRNGQRTISNAKNLNIQSYLLTKGIPFSPLSGYLHNLTESLKLSIQFDCLVDISHGGYTPVQTRTRINMPSKIQMDLRRLEKDLVFLCALRSARDGDISLDHRNSTNSVVQLRFFPNPYDETWNTPLDYLKNMRYRDQPSIVDLINTCITVMGEKLYTSVKNDISAIIVHEYNCGYKVINYDVAALVTDWLQNKNQEKINITLEKTIVELEAVKQPKHHFTDKELKRIESYYIKTIQNMVEKWVNNYWKTGERAKIVGFGSNIPKIKIILDFEDSVGFYSFNDHIITINIFDWDIKDIDELLQLFESNQAAGEKPVKITQEILDKLDKNNKIWNKSFALHYPETTIPHEIEHARRGEHQHAGHDSIYNALYPGDIAQTRTFSESTNAVYTKVLGSGFYDSLIF